MRRVIDYKTTHAREPDHLDFQVRDLMQKGWEPVGLPAVVQESGRSPMFTQTMIKYEEA